MKNYIDIFAALLTPTIALITTYIAIQQYRSSRLKQRLELYDRRLAVYNATMKFIRAAAYRKKLEDAAVSEFIVAIEAARFLFDRDVTDYLTTVYARATHQEALRQLEGRDSSEDEFKKRKREMVEHYTWLGEQDHEGLATKVFMKYLNLKQLR